MYYYCDIILSLYILITLVLSPWRWRMRRTMLEHTNSKIYST